MADPVADGQAAAASPLPQLDPSSFPNQIFWLAVALVLIWWILSRIALPRIGAVLAERAGTISNDIAAAEELALKVKEAESAYDKALADARAEANRIVAETRAEIQADLDAATAKADAMIAEKAAQSEKAIAVIRSEAASSVREVAGQVAVEIVSALGGQANAEAVAPAVDARVKG